MPDEPAVKPTRAESWSAWWRRYRRTVAGIALLTVSIAVLIYMALRGSTTAPPTAIESALLVLVASGFQIASVFVFNGNGRADPTLASTAVRRLIALTNRAAEARLIAEAAEFGTATEIKKAMGTLSVQLSYIEEGIAEGAKDWAEFHPEATRKLEETDQ